MRLNWGPPHIQIFVLSAKYAKLGLEKEEKSSSIGGTFISYAKKMRKNMVVHILYYIKSNSKLKFFVGSFF